MSSFYVLQATEVSWQAFRDLRLQSLLEEPQSFIFSYESQKNNSDGQWQKSLKQYQEGNGSWMMFATDGSRLIGMLGAFQREEDKEENAAWIICAYIAKEWRRNGVGRLLMKSVLNELAKTSITKVSLCVNTAQIPAVNFYTSLGFQMMYQYARLFGDGKYHNEGVMEKIIKF